MFQRSCRHSPVADGGDHLAQFLGAYVSGGVQAVDTGFLLPVGEDITPLVQRRKPPEQAGLRLKPGKDEKAQYLPFRRPVLGHLPGLPVSPADGVQAPVCTGDRLHLHAGDHADFLMVPGLFGQGFGAGEILAPHQNGHMAGKAGEKHALLRRSVAAADDKDRFAGKKLPVADGADGDAPALEFLLALKAHTAGPGPCGRKDAETVDGALIGEDGFYIPFRFQRLCLRGKKFRAEALGLPAHDLRQLCPAGGEDAGIIGHLRAEGDLPA